MYNIWLHYSDSNTLISNSLFFYDWGFNNKIDFLSWWWVGIVYGKALYKKNKISDMQNWLNTVCFTLRTDCLQFQILKFHVV